jgi:hypothetical protein
MQCLLQVFGSDGSAQLSGGSNFKEHIGWLPLLAWSPHVTPRARDSAALRERSPRIVDVVFTISGDSPVVAVLQNVASGRYPQSSWSKAMIDCFTDADDPIWSLRVTMRRPLIAALAPNGSQGFRGPPVWEVYMNFASSSVDYRSPGIKVGNWMPSGAIWDPSEQVCKAFDPNVP